MYSSHLGWMEHQGLGSIIRSRRRRYLSISRYKTEGGLYWTVIVFWGDNLFHHRDGERERRSVSQSPRMFFVQRCTPKNPATTIITTTTPTM